jgi:hypothetical protein
MMYCTPQDIFLASPLVPDPKSVPFLLHEYNIYTCRASKNMGLYGKNVIGLVIGLLNMSYVVLGLDVCFKSGHNCYKKKKK